MKSNIERDPGDVPGALGGMGDVGGQGAVHDKTPPRNARGGEF
jgi:hypothetical protein